MTFCRAPSPGLLSSSVPCACLHLVVTGGHVGAWCVETLTSPPHRYSDIIFPNKNGGLPGGLTSLSVAVKDLNAPLELGMVITCL